MLHLPNSLETERLCIEQLKYEDAEEIFYTYASKLEATRFVSWPTHQTVADTNQYLQQAITAWQAGLDYSYAIRMKHNHRLVGSVGAVNEDGKVHFGYIISPTGWNQGYATEACTALLAQLVNQDGSLNIWTFVDAENLASIKVLHKIGMVEEARLPKWFRFVNQENQLKDCILFRWKNK